MNMKVRIYPVNKGKNNQCAYFATVKKQEIIKLNLKEGEAFLLKLEDETFPARLRKLNPNKEKSMLGFTIPYKIGKDLKLKDCGLTLISKNILSNGSLISKDSLNLIDLIPSRSIRKFPIYFFTNNEKLLVWIFSKGNKIAILPNCINLTEDQFNLLELAGAFFCEGFKSRKKNKHRDRFSFSNADLNQIKWFVEATEGLLKIQRNEWSVQVLYPKDDFGSVSRIKSYWSSFGLSKEKIKIVKNTKTNEECGVCILNIYNSSLAESFYYIAKECQQLSLKSKKNAIDFFRGLSRGDLGIGKTNNQVVSFSTESEGNAVFFKELCAQIGISTSQPLFDQRGKKGYWNVYISHYDNLKKLIEFDCVTHHIRKKNLYNKFLKAKKNKHLTYLDAIDNGHNTYRKLIDYLQIAESTSGAALVKYLRNGLLFREKNLHSYIYSISSKGKKELKMLKKLNEG